MSDTSGDGGGESGVGGGRAVRVGSALAGYDRRTLAATFTGAVDRHGSTPAVRWQDDGVWRDLSYREVEERVTRVASWLSGRGIGPGDRVGILSENRPEWAFVDYAALCLGATTVPVYPTLPADQVGHWEVD